MEKSATLNLRVNPVAKQRAEDVLKQLGISMSTAMAKGVNGMAPSSRASPGSLTGEGTL